VIAAAENATDEWRKEHGLDKWMEGAVPGWLQGSIPTPDGGKLRISRYTPFGAFGDLGGTITGNILPQYAGAYFALRGQDWTGKPIRNPDGSEASDDRKALLAIGSFIDATVPIVAQAKRIEDQGIGALNPMRPVKPAKKKRRGTARKAGPVATGPARSGPIGDGPIATGPAR
jgi:hypothetical protein